MDPQACLTKIIELVWAMKTRDPTVGEEQLDYDYSELADAFDDLGGWLKKGGHVPAAQGYILGECPVAVGYPGMLRGALPRWEQRKVLSARSSRYSYTWRWSLMVTDAYLYPIDGKPDGVPWQVIEYSNEMAVGRWGLAPYFYCPYCGRVDSLPSQKAPNRCLRCDDSSPG